MTPMKALVGFSDPRAATERNPTGACAAGSPFEAPSAEAAKELEDAGLAVRDKPAPTPKA